MRCGSCGSDYSRHVRAPEDGCWQCVKDGGVELDALDPEADYDIQCSTEALLMLKGVHEETGGNPLIVLLERARY